MLRRIVHIATVGRPPPVNVDPHQISDPISFAIHQERYAEGRVGRFPDAVYLLCTEGSQLQKLLSSLLGLKNLSNDMLHDLQGVSIDKINKAFQPPQQNVGRANHEWLIPTLHEIVALLANGANLGNPYQQINRYLLTKLRS
jgi:hypothetical protein